jgi:hypothetical protein
MNMRARTAVIAPRQDVGQLVMVMTRSAVARSGLSRTQGSK